MRQTCEDLEKWAMIQGVACLQRVHVETKTFSRQLPKVISDLLMREKMHDEVVCVHS